jgi:hypothetical protein
MINNFKDATHKPLVLNHQCSDLGHQAASQKHSVFKHWHCALSANGTHVPKKCWRSSFNVCFNQGRPFVWYNTVCTLWHLIYLQHGATISGRQVAVASTSGSQYGTCLTSPFWRKRLWDGFWIFFKKKYARMNYSLFYDAVSVSNYKGKGKLLRRIMNWNRVGMMKFWLVLALECGDWRP